ncbi:MAG: PepSY domain-containing protein [Candidatus Gastranaerophilales bacterium]|nr:PepSY domain-containing protein [Candidatus Gastranaerophilales bacterium]
MKRYSRKNLRNIQTIVQEKTGAVITSNMWDWRRIATAAAALILMVGVAGFPVRAFVTSVINERMENIPKEEVQEINDMVQSISTDEDVFSREYSDGEKERDKELWQAYKDGQFPENVIAQVDHAEDATEEMLCYIRSTGVFHLPTHEMTDEELLEIIDFQHKMSYAVSQSSAAQEVKTQMQAEQDQLREEIRNVGGISQEEAIEIATKQMESELGEAAQGKEIMKYRDGSVAITVREISEQEDPEHAGDVAYWIVFGNPNDSSTYYCLIDAVDGSVLKSE